MERWSKIAPAAIGLSRSEALFWILNEHISHPSPCQVCGANTKFRNNAYSKTCGYSCRSLSSGWLASRKQTCISRYGKTNAYLAGAEGAKKTNLERYGVEVASSSPVVRDKINQTMLNRYGAKNPSNVPVLLHKKSSKKRKTFIGEIEREKGLVALFNHEDYLGLSSATKSSLQWKCTHCNTEFSSRWQEYRPHCPKCEPKHLRTLEGKLYEMLVVELGRDRVRLNDRTLIYPREIDILIGDLAIELNGMYWHRNDINNTESKRQCLLDAGYRFMMFFEDEVRNSPDIVCSMILHKLKLSSNKIHARQTKVIEVDDEQARQFTTENHLGGYLPGIALGLESNSDLVAIAIFGRKRFSKTGGIELLRFCIKRKNAVVGAHTKLILAGRKQLGEITSFVDRRFLSSKPVEAVAESTAGYFYWDSKAGRRLHRLSCTKAKLAKRLNKDPDSGTEFEFAEELGLYKMQSLGVYTCLY